MRGLESSCLPEIAVGCVYVWGEGLLTGWWITHLFSKYLFSGDDMRRFLKGGSIMFWVCGGGCEGMKLEVVKGRLGDD